ncbi:MAG TPA: HlyD family secretion protein [Paenirhodobacter sp.]
MNKTLILPTLIAAVIGVSGLLLLLFAWHLPPFAHSQPFTENAYLRGKVTTLSPQLSGYLNEVAVVDFQEVKQGDLIARIDDQIFRQKLAQAQATLAAAQAALQVANQNVASAQAVERANQAALLSAQSTLATAQTNAERSRALTHRGVTSQQSSDQIELTLQQATGTLHQAEAQLDVQHENILSAQVQISARNADIANAEATVELARIDLSHTEIRAPADGHLGQIGARVGQYVTAGTALVSHVGRDMWVIANFKETELAGIQIGQDVQFRVDALAGQAFTGKVESFSPATASEFSVLSGSNATGNFTKIAQRLPVRISITPDQDHASQLSVGMSVEVTVNTRD